MNHINSPSENSIDGLLEFSTSDPDEFVDSMSPIAPGLRCSRVGPHGMSTRIVGARLPDLGIFASTLENFRVQSAARPYYGVTIPLAGHSRFLVGTSFEDCDGDGTTAHL